MDLFKDRFDKNIASSSFLFSYDIKCNVFVFPSFFPSVSRMMADAVEADMSPDQAEQSKAHTQQVSQGLHRHLPGYPGQV